MYDKFRSACSYAEKTLLSSVDIEDDAEYELAPMPRKRGKGRKLQSSK